MSAISALARPLRRGVLVLLLIAAVFAVGGGASASNGGPVAATHGRDDGPKPTIVLVHGAWADASGWNDVVSKLQRRGYPVIAPANPLRGLAGDSAYIRSVLQSIQGPVVVVGHSYGGAVISNAATGLPNVKALVYIAAFVPDSGDTIGGLLAINPVSQIGPTTLLFRRYPGPGGAISLDSYIATHAFHAAFAADLPRSVTSVMAATQRPADPVILVDASGAAAWRTVPSWYLVASQDKTIPPATQRLMAQRAGSTTVEIRSSHVAMMSHPDETTRLITAAARATT